MKYIFLTSILAVLYLRPSIEIVKVEVIKPKKFKPRTFKSCICPIIFERADDRTYTFDKK